KRMAATAFELAAQTTETEQDAGAYLARSGYRPAYTMLEMEMEPAVPAAVMPLPAGYDLRPVAPEHQGAIWQCIGDAHDVPARGGEDPGRHDARERHFGSQALRGARLPNRGDCPALAQTAGSLAGSRLRRRPGRVSKSGAPA